MLHLPPSIQLKNSSIPFVLTEPTKEPEFFSPAVTEPKKPVLVPVPTETALVPASSTGMVAKDKTSALIT